MNVGRNYTVYVGEKSLFFFSACSSNTLRHALFQIIFFRLKKKGVGERHNIYNTSPYGHRTGTIRGLVCNTFRFEFFSDLSCPSPHPCCFWASWWAICKWVVQASPPLSESTTPRLPRPKANLAASRPPKLGRRMQAGRLHHNKYDHNSSGTYDTGRRRPARDYEQCAPSARWLWRCS